MAAASCEASRPGHGNWLSLSARSVIQCQAVWPTSTDRMMGPQAFGDDEPEQVFQHRDEHHEDEQLPELHAQIERQERGQQVGPGELQRVRAARTRKRNP